MPSPNPTVRRQHSGNAVPTTLSAPIASSADTSFTIAASTGWPDGSVGNFIVTINAGQSDVEKILCSTRVGTTVNVVTRGYDSTTAAGHAGTATVTHSISAVEVDEMNQHTNATAGVHGVAGSVVGTSDAQTLTNKTLTSPTINTPTINTPTIATPTITSATVNSGLTATNPASGTTVFTTTTGSSNGVIIQPGTAASIALLLQGLASQVGPLLRAKMAATPSGNFIECLDSLSNTLFSVASDGTTTLGASSTLGGVSGTSLAADRTAWTTYTPTFTNVTSGAGIFAYKLIGKLLHIRGHFTAGTATANAIIRFSLPAGLTVSTSFTQPLAGVLGFGQTPTSYVAGLYDGTTVTTSTGPAAGASLSGFATCGVIEVL